MNAKPWFQRAARRGERDFSAGPGVSGGARSPDRLRRAVHHAAGRALRVLGACAALLMLMGDDGIGRDELDCELAVDRLETCCPGFPSRMLMCIHGGCDSMITPDLTLERSACLRSKTCEQLIASGACDPERWEPHPTCTPPCSPKVPPCM